MYNITIEVFILALVLICNNCYSKSLVVASPLIESEEVIYARVDYTDILRVWEIEFDVKPKTMEAVKKTLRQKNLKADIYYPPRRDVKEVKPLIIFMFGSAFMPKLNGRKDKSIVMLCKEFASRGYVTASVQYRTMNLLTPSFTKSGYVATQDSRAALRHFVNHSEKYGIDVEKVFVGGVSAGAITAINTAMLDTDDSMLDKDEKLGRMYGCLDCVGERKLKNYTIRGIIKTSALVAAALCIITDCIWTAYR